MPVRRRVLVTILAALTAVALVGAPTEAKRRNRRAPKIMAFLTGYEEVPTVSTSAEGQLSMKIVKASGTQTLNYRLEYKNILNATAAHIHLGGYGVNGGVAAFLCGGGDKPACPPTGGTVTGTIDSADVVGPAAQGIAPGEIGELIQALKAGVAYANVHTDDGDVTPNTGPGDLSTGEIRGQLGYIFFFSSRARVVPIAASMPHR